MSTVSLGYPEVIRVQRLPAIGRILVLSNLVLIAMTILVMVISATNADLTTEQPSHKIQLQPFLLRFQLLL
jgi:hypothetical protein